MKTGRLSVKGTIDLMKYLRDYPLKEGAIHERINDFIVSNCSDESKELIQLMKDEGLWESFVYQGMEREGNPISGWTIIIGDRQYFATL